MTTPSPTTWTLRLKSHKTTLLLHTDPLTTFPTLKSHLLTALRETGLQSTNNEPITLPSSPSDIQFGRPRNPHDPEQGFVLGEWEYQNEEGEDGGDDEGKGKGKAPAKIPGRGKQATTSIAKNCPKGAGLRDGAVLAFRFRSSVDKDEDREEGEGEEVDMWDVRIPKFEDTYGAEEEGDVGGRREFEG